MSLTGLSLRRLWLASVLTGLAAGVLLFALQHALLLPLIERAESYEHASHAVAQTTQAFQDGHAGHDVPAEWQPSDGMERSAYTALGTVVTGIGCAAIALGLAQCVGWPLDARRGALLGLAGFAAVALAPSAGLPPRLPGVPGAELYAAQIWWCLTVALTSAGLWMLCRPKASWPGRAAGVLVVFLPHLLGAPAAGRASLVPGELSERFAWLSVGTRLPFWMLIGILGGHLIRQSPAEDIR